VEHRADDAGGYSATELLRKIKALREAGLRAEHVAFSFMKRRVQPLMARDTLRYQYTSKDDTSRMPGGEIDDDIVERLGRIFKDMPPYTPCSVPEYSATHLPNEVSSRSPWETDPVCLLLTGAEVEGSTIPGAVPIEGIVPEAEVAAGAATELAKIASGVAPGVAEEVRDDVLTESSLEVVVHSPEIQDAEPIHSTPMCEAAATSRGGLELLADDLVDPVTVARNLEAMRWAEQWMMVCISTLG
jgi:hypothetical protein